MSPRLSSGFVPGSRSQRARIRRRSAVAQLVTGSALAAGLMVAIGVVLIDIARASPMPAVQHGTGIAIAAFVAVMLAGLGGLAAITWQERHDRRA